MFEPDKITRNGAPSNGSAQKDTPLREASKPLMLQGKMWVIADAAAGLQPRSDARGGALALAAGGGHVSPLPCQHRGPDPAGATFAVRLNRDPFVIADRLWVKDRRDPDEEKLRFSIWTRVR